MPVGRNDPCPCGSGKKYKSCCLPLDDARARAQRRLGLDDRAGSGTRDGFDISRTAALDDPWEVDLVPLLGQLGDDPAARVVGLIIVAGGYVLRADVLTHPPAEPGALATVIERALSEAIKVGRSPREVQVRHDSVARALAPLLAGRRIGVVVNPELPGANDAGRGLRAHMSGGDTDVPPASAPETWAGWQLEGDQIGRLFAASAAYFRAAPWVAVADDRPLVATVPGGGAWTVIILGNAGETFGLAMYADPDDVAALYAAADPRDALSSVSDAMISITFGKGADVSPSMRREIRHARWEVAGPSAYPLLMVIGTPGGGITRRQMDDLIAALESVPRFVTECERSRRDGMGSEVVTWTDPATRVELAISPDEPGNLWSEPAELAAAGPEGPGARPGARLDPEREQDATDSLADLLARFAAFLEKPRRGRRSAAAVSKHVLATRLFLDFLTSYQTIPPHAVTEFDLREFLYRWYPQKVLDTATRAKALLASLTFFFDFMEHAEGVRCPWAEPILSDRETFVARWESSRPAVMGGADQEWVGELTDDLVARVLLPAMDAEGGAEWGRFAGMVEADLWDELQRLWIVWRDDLIRSGVTDRGEVISRLLARQRRWSETPNAIAEGRTPARAIAREQKKSRTWDA